MDTDYEFMSEVGMSEEEMREIDAALDSVQDLLLKYESLDMVMDLQRLAQLKFTYMAMKHLTNGTDADVTYKICQPFKHIGSVTVEAKNLEILNPELFSRAAEFASSTEVYTLIDGRVQLVFGFNGLAKPIV